MTRFVIYGTTDCANEVIVKGRFEPQFGCKANQIHKSGVPSFAERRVGVSSPSGATLP